MDQQSVLGPMEERYYARRESRKVLAMYHVMRAEHPELTGTELYQTIVASLTRSDADVANVAAQAIVRAAGQSFAAWPSERALTFRDVVHYLCFECFTRSRHNKGWTLTSIREVVDSVIPKDL